MNIKEFDDIKIDECSLSLQDKNDVLIVKMVGQLNTYNSTPFQKKIETILHTSYRKIIFDMERLNYVSSTGIGAFTQILKVFGRDANPGVIVLSGVTPKVYEVFQLLGFNSFFRIFDDLQNALKHFEGHNEVSIFPRVLVCPICNMRIKASKSGRFRCTKCRSIIVIDSERKIFKE